MPTVTVTMDTSKKSWGAINPLVIGYPVSGLWRTLSHSLHVNVLDIARVDVQADGPCCSDRGNSTTVAYINHQGGDYVVVSHSAVC